MTISVAMCTYNGTRFLKEQLDSILSQTLLPDEIIICDDCSTDGTAKLAMDLLSGWDGSWKVVKNETNLGFRKNFEKAIQLCHGDLIFLSDQDDVWLPPKIEIMAQIFKVNSDIMLAFHDAELVDESLQLIAPSFWQILDFDSKCFLRKDYRQILAYNVVQGSSCAFRRELVSIACPFPDGAIHDEWLAMTALSKGQLFPVAKVLLKYRQWGKNALGVKIPSIKDRLKKWFFSAHEAIELHRKYIDYKFQIDEIWERKYGEKIKITNPNLFAYNQLVQKRYECIHNKNFGFLWIWRVYIEMYPQKMRWVKEILKDTLAVMI